VVRKEPRQALLTKATGRRGRRILLEERQRDRAVDLAEHVRGAGPEAPKLGAQLVRHRDPCADEVRACARERPQRLGLISVGHQDPVAVAVGPG